MRLSRWLGLYGPLLLALYFVATARWGSYLLPGPPYIGDLALAGLIGHRAWSLTRRTALTPLLSRSIVIPTGLLLLLTAVSLTAGEWTITAARDAAPYLYAVLVLFGQSYREIRPRTLEWIVYGALILHAAWYTAADLFPALMTVTSLGDSQVHLLQPRGDIDGAFIGILAALALDRTTTGRTPFASAAVAAWALALILANQSRAGLLASLCVIGFIALRHVAIRWRHSREPGSAERRRVGGSRGRANPALAVAVAMVVPLGVTAISGTPEALQRSVNVVTKPGSDGATGGTDAAASGGSPGSVYGPNNGVGTARARTESWTATVEWIHADGISRAAFGTGFGPHYMQLSGADRLLLGDSADPAVRAIHNYAINTWARLGAVGLILIGWIAILAVVAAIRLVTRSSVPPTLDLLAALLVIAIPVTALVGVVLESPFGAIPYFWAIGYLSARMVEEGSWQALQLPQRDGAAARR